MKFSDQYGPAVDKPINAVAYELTEGGDTCRGKPETWRALNYKVLEALHEFDDMKHITLGHVRDAMNEWHRVNEEKKD